MKNGKKMYLHICREASLVLETAWERKGEIFCLCVREREGESSWQTKRGQTVRQSWQDWSNRCVCVRMCVCVCVCHKACYGPWSGIGWPQLSRSHWRRFHRRSVQSYSAILPGPRGAPASTLRHFAHTHTHTHTHRRTTHIHTHIFENTTYSHIYTKKHTAQLWNHTHSQTDISHLDVQF